MPDFPLIDSHVHLYDTARLSYPWLGAVPTIAQSHLPADFDRARGAIAVDKIVLVEADAAVGQNLAEARFAAALAASDPRIAGIVAQAPLERGAAVTDDLATLARLPPVRGVRRLLQGEPDPEFCLRQGFITGVRLLARYGWPFDICIFHHQLAAATELARRCPEVTFVLDHLGKPAIKAGLTEPWQSHLTRLARLPNVVCKISGVITEADHACWNEAAIRPYVEHAIACFGFDRVLFGSDWPVLELAGDYVGWVAILDRILAGASATERRKFYRDNAIRIYRLAQASPPGPSPLGPLRTHAS